MVRIHGGIPFLIEQYDEVPGDTCRPERVKWCDTLERQEHFLYHEPLVGSGVDSQHLSRHFYHG